MLAIGLKSLDFLRQQSEQHFATRCRFERAPAPTTLIVGAVAGGSERFALLEMRTTSMPKLNDTQTILLSTASQRKDLAFYPLTYATAGARVTNAITGLVKAGLAERRGEDAVFATIAGLIAIGVEAGQSGSDAPTGEPPAQEPRTTKAAAILAMLQREAGATLPELIAVTGWLPHTTRAALTGLRKKGHAIERFKRDEASCYRILAVAQ